MFNWKDGLEFRRRFFNVFMGSVYLGIISCAFTLSLVMSTYLNELEFVEQARQFCTFALIFSVLQSVFCLMVSRGYASWVWGTAGLFVLFFVIVLPAIFYSPNTVLYMLALICPLVGLYHLRSVKYQQMVRWLSDNKARRENGS
jgi:hypothetical protein